MAENTKIQWTDHTFNGWIGCSKVSPGCKNCYAEVDNPARISRSRGLELWGPKANRRLTSNAYWSKPLQWNRQAEKVGQPAKVFCASQSDVFEGWQGQLVNDQGRPLWMHQGDLEMQAVVSENCPGLMAAPYTLSLARERLWQLIESTPWLIWQLLTKRPENMHFPFVPEHWEEGGWPDNVWAMTSVENQEQAGRRIPELLKVRAKVLGLSCEPLLGPINLEPCLQYPPFHEHYKMTFGVDEWRGVAWVIIGGESGHGARPCNLDWIRSLVQQCREAETACFVKQLGSAVCGRDGEAAILGNQTPMFGNGAWKRIFDPKGGDPEEWPEDLRVRKFPCP